MLQENKMQGEDKWRNCLYISHIQHVDMILYKYI